MDMPPLDQIGIVVVDHGSRRAESNAMLLDVVSMFRRQSDYTIIEPAHMELAEPTIAMAFDRCVQRGALLIVIHPYFLLPGRHWDRDIPTLAADAARSHPGTAYLITAPLGLHPGMAGIIADRIQHCLARVQGQADSCDVCRDRAGCQLAQSADEREEKTD